MLSGTRLLLGSVCPRLLLTASPANPRRHNPPLQGKRGDVLVRVRGRRLRRLREASRNPLRWHFARGCVGGPSYSCAPLVRVPRACHCSWREGRREPNTATANVKMRAARSEFETRFSLLPRHAKKLRFGAVKRMRARPAWSGYYLLDVEHAKCIADAKYATTLATRENHFSESIGFDLYRDLTSFCQHPSYQQ